MYQEERGFITIPLKRRQQMISHPVLKKCWENWYQLWQTSSGVRQLRGYSPLSPRARLAYSSYVSFESQPVFVSRVPHASASLISLPSASFYPLASPKPAFVSPVSHFLLAVSRLCPFLFLLLWPLTLRQSLHLLLTR